MAILQRQPLLAFDFDGTLAPIVAHPKDARVSQAVSVRLSALADRLPLAVMTGRTVDDVRQRLRFEPRFIVGNHGAEHGGHQQASPAHALDQLRSRLLARQADLASAGVLVEDKGASIALHYRLSRVRQVALDLIAELLQPGDDALRVFGGKMVVNVSPRGAPDKSDAVKALLERCAATCAVYAGDDGSDEPVFAAAPPDWLTIRVGRDEPRSRARFFLDSPIEMALALDRMLMQLP